ncbi:MAG: hypothetical protein AABX38_01960 [Candidatus Micrarchaeota archaeon]
MGIIKNNSPRILDLEILNKLTTKSKLSKEDIEELTELIKYHAAKRVKI